MFNAVSSPASQRSPFSPQRFSQPGTLARSVKPESVDSLRSPPSPRQKKATAEQLFAVTRAFHATLAAQRATSAAGLVHDNNSVYRSPRLEEAARMMQWKTALYPNERVYSTRRAAFRPGNERRTVQNTSSDDSDMDMATDREHTPDPILLGTPSARDKLRWSSQMSSQRTERHSSFTAKPMNLSADFQREQPFIPPPSQHIVPSSNSVLSQALQPPPIQRPHGQDPLNFLSGDHWSPRQPVAASTTTGGSQFKFPTRDTPSSFAAAQRLSQSRQASRKSRSYASLSTVEEKMNRWTKSISNFILAINQGKNVLSPARLNPLKEMLQDMVARKASVPAGDELQTLLVALRMLEDVGDDRTELVELKDYAREMRLHF